jgi:hypothetical protein
MDQEQQDEEVTTMFGARNGDYPPEMERAINEWVGSRVGVPLEDCEACWRSKLPAPLSDQSYGYVDHIGPGHRMDFFVPKCEAVCGMLAQLGGRPQELEREGFREMFEHTCELTPGHIDHLPVSILDKPIIIGTAWWEPYGNFLIDGSHRAARLLRDFPDRPIMAWVLTPELTQACKQTYADVERGAKYLYARGWVPDVADIAAMGVSVDLSRSQLVTRVE